MALEEQDKLVEVMLRESRKEETEKDEDDAEGGARKLEL